MKKLPVSVYQPVTFIGFLSVIITLVLYFFDLPPVPQMIDVEKWMFGAYSPKGTCIGLWLIVCIVLMGIYFVWKVFRTPVDEE